MGALSPSVPNGSPRTSMLHAQTWWGPGSRISIFCTQAEQSVCVTSLQTLWLKTSKKSWNEIVQRREMLRAQPQGAQMSNIRVSFQLLLLSEGILGKEWGFLIRRKAFICVLSKGLSFGKAIAVYFCSKWCINGIYCTFPWWMGSIV